VTNEDADGKESRHVRRVRHTSIGTVTYVSINFVEKEGKKPKRW